MNEITFTKKCSQFATEHHNLIFSFLRSRDLDENEYYDVIVFGFLKAVEEYLTNLKLSQKYEFSTIAYRAMRSELYKHYEKQNRQKRKAYTISLEAVLYGDEDALSLQEVLTNPDPLMMDLETELLMLELASKVSKREMDVIRMKTEGYGVRDIAKSQRMPMKCVNELLAGIQDVVLAVCGR